MRSDASTLLTERLFRDLHDDLLAFLKKIADRGLLLCGARNGPFRGMLGGKGAAVLVRPAFMENPSAITAAHSTGDAMRITPPALADCGSAPVGAGRHLFADCVGRGTTVAPIFRFGATPAGILDSFRLTEDHGLDIAILFFVEHRRHSRTGISGGRFGFGRLLHREWRGRGFGRRLGNLGDGPGKRSFVRRSVRDGVLRRIVGGFVVLGLDDRRRCGRRLFARRRFMSR